MDGNPPRPLSSGQRINAEHPFALIAGKNSFMEIHQKNLFHSAIIRIGRSTALEMSSHDSSLSIRDLPCFLTART